MNSGTLMRRLFGGVNQPVDKLNVTELEKKHLPIIAAPDGVKIGEPFEVTVEVGKLLAHPNAREHFVAYIELYADDVYLCRANLTAVSACPKVSFMISLPRASKQLQAFQRCNVHGVWTTQRPIQVMQ